MNEDTGTGLKGLEARRREELLRRAASFLASNPHATTAQIAPALELSRATLHRYFGRREALVATVLERADEALLEATTRARLTDGEHLKALHRLIDELWDSAPYMTVLYEIHGGAEMNSQTSAWDEADRRIIAFFDAGKQAAVFVPDLTASWMAEALYSLVLAGEWSVREGRSAPRDAASFIHRLFTGGAVLRG